MTVLGTPIKATSDKDGCFSLGVVPIGTWKVWHLWNPDGVSAAVDQVQLTGRHAARFTLGLLAVPLTVPATGLEIPLSLDTSIEGAFTAELRVQGTAETTTIAETVALKATVAPPPVVQVGNPCPLSLAPGAKAQVGVKALNPGAAGVVTAFLKLTWQPGQGSVDVKLTASWA